MPDFQIWPMLPTLIPVIFGLLLIMAAPILRHDQRLLWGISVGVTVLYIGLVAWMLGVIDDYGGAVETGGMAGLPMVRTDRLALSLDIVFGFAGLLALLIAPSYLDRSRSHPPEVYPLILIAIAGMAAMVGTEHLLMVFIGLEVLSISLYVLTGIARDRLAPVEAALKYFLLGAFSTSFFVFGLALVLGTTGHLDLPGIAAAVRTGAASGIGGTPMLLAGIALIIIAFAFKVAAVPFHFWAPDVYQGAPTPVTAFMAAGTKAAAFGVLVRLLYSGFDATAELTASWAGVIAGLAVLTMIGGNLLALVQQRVKRLLAYSSIAHAGYLLLALVPPTGDVIRGGDELLGPASVVFYLVVYTFMTVGAFAVVSLFQEEGEDADHISNFAGLWYRRPWIAAAMAVFLLSLTGIPPLGGFTGKYVIFMAAIDAGHPVLAAVMAIAAAIGAAYYLRVLVALFLSPPEAELSANLRVPWATAVALVVAVIATFALGLAPAFVYEPLTAVLAVTPF
jgi:NADH-quinone oxidoreductase subunit N